MSLHTLTVHFHGICTHFRDVIAGVPHRTVLPDATPMRSGRVQIGERSVKHYVIHPHYAAIAIPGKKKIDVPWLIEGGKIVRGVRLQIMNATTGGVAYDEDTYKKIPALVDYVPHYRPSAEVVHGGRAQCYFDLFSGKVSTEERGKERHVRMTIQTEGHPILQVTPLVMEPPLSSSEVCKVTLDSDTLILANASAHCRKHPHKHPHKHRRKHRCKHSSLDFLLNYLTGEGGIPHVVSKDFPLDELTPDPSDAVDPQHFTSEAEFVPATAEELLRHIDQEGELLMCSDSRYP